MKDEFRTEKEIVESYNNKVLRKIEYIERKNNTDIIIISFTDDTKLTIEASEWFIINPTNPCEG